MERQHDLRQDSQEKSMNPSDLSEVAIAVSKWKSEASEKLKGLLERPANINSCAEDRSLSIELERSSSSSEKSISPKSLVGKSQSLETENLTSPADQNFMKCSKTEEPTSTSTTHLIIDATTTLDKSVMSMQVEDSLEMYSSNHHHSQIQDDTNFFGRHEHSIVGIVSTRQSMEFSPLFSDTI